MWKKWDIFPIKHGGIGFNTNKRGDHWPPHFRWLIEMLVLILFFLKYFSYFEAKMLKFFKSLLASLVTATHMFGRTPTFSALSVTSSSVHPTFD